MKPAMGQLLSCSQAWKALITSGVQQQAEPPATVEARMPMQIFSPATPWKPGMGSEPQGVIPWKLRQLRQTSWRNSTDPDGNQYQLLQAWGMQKSIQSSACLTIFTKQLQYPDPVSASGTPMAWQITTHSGAVVSNLQPLPKLFISVLSFMMALATVVGGVLQFQISRSTPSRSNLSTQSTKEAAKLSMLALEANTFCQLPFCPPTESSTFLPAAFHAWKGTDGKLASSIITLPSV